MPKLTYARVKELVATHNKATSFSNQLILAICWKESNFDTDATPGVPGNTSKGLMQVNDPALDTVNDNTPTGVHYSPSDMLSAEKAIEAGSYYLQIILDKFPGVTSVAQALDHFKGDGTSVYHVNLLAAEACLKGAADDGAALGCLRAIHD